MFKKIVLFLLTFILIFLFNFNSSYAQEEFIIGAEVIYSISESGKTTVTNNIRIENATSEVYATSYTLSLDKIDPQNARAYSLGSPLPMEVNKENETTSMQVSFNNAIVGKGNSRIFSIVFELDNLATKTGEVWEIAIPRFTGETSFKSASLILEVPTAFGNEAYVSPDPSNKTTRENKYVYTFLQHNMQNGIIAAFGNFQIFAFNLNYHIENPLSKSSIVDIALPPDTAYQKMYYQKIDPEPNKVYVDEDGNWLATYSLEPRERIDVKVTGAVEIFATHRKFPPSSTQTLQNNLKESQYWQINDQEINSLGKSLKTPRAIYDYVSQNLEYNYDRVKPNIERLGAKEALNNPTNAICMEFTDLFIALARSAGIPAREINGFAYTENPEIQPLSLVADVLHAWPEYWDSQNSVWVPVDPTWGSTTNGLDYFTKLDLRHFTFVIHGIDSQKPYPPGSYKLGTNPQKDVFVNFGQLPNEKNADPKVLLETKSSLPFFGKTKALLKITNEGTSASYNLNPEIYFDNKSEDEDLIDILPPFGFYEKEIAISYGIFGKDAPSKITVLVAGKKIDYPIDKTEIIINHALALFIVLVIVSSFIILKIKKVSLNPFKHLRRTPKAPKKYAEVQTKPDSYQ